MTLISSRFGKYLTSYDLLKFFAVVTMVIDHIGFYLFPHVIELRIIGRLSSPCWMFLAGFSKSLETGKNIFIGCFILILTNCILGTYLLPLNILALIIVTRLFLKYMGESLFRRKELIFYCFLVMTIISLPTYYIFEYSTYGVMIAMAAYALRRHGETALQSRGEKILLGSALGIYVLGQVGIFMFNPIEIAVLMLSICILGVVLYKFVPREYPDLTEKLPAPIVWILQFCGRYSLEIYVVHLIMLWGISVYLGYHSSDFLHPTLFYQW